MSYFSFERLARALRSGEPGDAPLENQMLEALRANRTAADHRFDEACKNAKPGDVVEHESGNAGCIMLNEDGTFPKRVIADTLDKLADVLEDCGIDPAPVVEAREEILPPLRLVRGWPHDRPH